MAKLSPYNRLNKESMWILITVVVDVAIAIPFLAYTVSIPITIISISTVTTLIWILRLISGIELLFKKRPEVLHDVHTALKKAEELYDTGEKNIDAMWTVYPYDENLKKYFSKMTTKSVYTTRLIDRETIPEEQIVEHLKDSWESLKTDVYSVYLIPKTNFEIIIVDYEDSAIFHYPEKHGRYGCIFITQQSKDFSIATQGIFKDLKKSGTKFPIENFNESFEENEVKEWLKSEFSEKK